MDNTVAVKKLMEYYGIPPQHNSKNKGDASIIKNIEGEFSLPIEDVIKLVRFDQIQNAYEHHMRRIGKELNTVLKQICR